MVKGSNKRPDFLPPLIYLICNKQYFSGEQKIFGSLERKHLELFFSFIFLKTRADPNYSSPNGCVALLPRIFVI